MGNDRVVIALARLRQQAGIEGCALVDSSAGMVWHVCDPQQGGSSLWEAAADYWRLYGRQQPHFGAIGTLRATLLHHEAGMLGIFPCCDDPPLVLVARAQPDGIDWKRCEHLVLALGSLLRSLHDRSLASSVVEGPARR